MKIPTFSQLAGKLRAIGRQHMHESMRSSRRRKAGRRVQVLEQLESRVLLTAGDLDPTFGTGGIVFTNFGPAATNDNVVYNDSMVVQADGKILISGSSGGNFALVRYNTNGSLDTSFDGDGKVTTDFGSGGDFGYAVAVQSDGKIVVAGGDGTNFALARYNANGSLDTSFDGDGKLTTVVGTSFGEASAVAVQTDGKILAAGYADNASGNYRFALVRYNANGSLDTSFDGDGKLTTDVGTADDDLAYAMTVQADGKILVTGTSYNGTNDDVALVRYNTNGSLDTSFDGDGKLTTTFTASFESGNSVAVQADGKIVLAGFTRPGANDEFAVARYNTNGSLDTTFDGDGKVTTSVGSGNDQGYSVAIQADGKIVVSGDSVVGSDLDFGLVRYNTNGSLDTTFGVGGKVTTNIQSTSADSGYSVALQSDGKILVGGRAFLSGSTDFALVRYQADPAFSATANLSVTTHGNETGPVNIVYTVTLSAANTTGTAITFDLDDPGTGTAISGLDYTAIAGNAVISVANGTSTGTLTVLVTNDTLLETTETVIAQISNSSNGSVTIGTASATANITDNDTATASLSVTTHGNETGPVNIVYTVTLSKTNNTGSAITFDLDDLGTGTANSGSDYTAIAGNAVISVANGTSTGTLTVLVTDDANVETMETVIVQISNSSNGAVTISTASATADITDNDIANLPPTAVALTPSSASLAENSSTASATVVSAISVTDDGQGTNVLSLTGVDASSFEIVGNNLRLKAGVALDFETKPSYTVTVNVDDASVGGSPDASATFTLNLTNSSELSGINVNQGQTQRSFVRYLDILFDVGGQDLLNLISGNRLQLTRFDLNGNNGMVQALPIAPAPAASGSMIQLDFGVQGITGNRGTNVGDGYYEIALDMDGNGSFESKRNFHRLLGDVTGNGIVDTADKSQVLAGQGGMYSAENDVNGDGVVNVADTTLVTRAFGRRLNLFP